MPDGQPLTKLPIFTEEHAECGSCELKPRMEHGKTAYAYRPEKFNGIMLIGEGPGQQEVVHGRPFVGKSGRALRDILDSVGIDMDECYITNATLCRPPPKAEAFHKAFPNAITSCLSRLEDEIAAVRPRVIITLGATAFIAITGYHKEEIKRVRFDCDRCDENRKVGPVLQCSAKRPNPDDGGKTATACGELHFLKAESVERVDPDELAELRAAGCRKCGARMKRQRPKLVKCPKCGGKKMRPETFIRYVWNYNLSGVAGALFEPAAEGESPDEHEVDDWFGAQGVRYIIPTYHPSHLIRGEQFLAKTVQKHCLKGKRLLTRDSNWKVDYEVTDNPDVVRAFCCAWMQSGESAPNFAVDVETEAVKVIDGEEVKLDARELRNVTKIKCIGIGTTEKVLVVDTRKVDPDSEEDLLLDALQDFLENPHIPKTFHNGLYDVPVIAKVWGIPWENMLPSYTDDTLGAHHNLYPDEPHDLGHVTFEMTEAHAWKPSKEQKGTRVHEDFDELALYNARDVLATARCREEMGVDRGHAIPGARMHRGRLDRVYELDSKLRRIAISMTMRGLPIDKKQLVRANETSQSIMDEKRDEMRTLLEAKTSIPDPQEFNPNAPKQLRTALFKLDGFGLPVLSTTQTGPSTNASDLRRLSSLRTENEDGVAFVKLLLDYREQAAIKNNLLKAMEPWPEDGRAHPTWKPWGTRTGRFSSSPNFQNQPKWLRAFVVAPEGRRIVGADFDQLELRILGVLSGDKALIDKCMSADDSRKLEPDHDPHSYIAAMAFGTQYTGLELKDPKHDKTNFKCKCQTCKRKALRDLVKRVIYGLMYGSGDQTVLEAIYSTGDYVGPPITIEMVGHVRRTIFRVFSGVDAWRKQLVEDATAKGEVRSPMYGRRRIWPLEPPPITEVYNYPIQSCAADVINQQTVKLVEGLDAIDPSAFLIAQVHDALYLECDENRAEAVADFLEETLTYEYERDGITVTFTAGAAISNNWKEAA